MMAAAYVSIGERIALIRRRRGMSQAVLAGRLGRSVQWLSMIERGVRRADRYSILVPIADVLGVPVAELTRDVPVESSRPDVQHEAGQAVRLALSGHSFVGTASEPIGGDDLAELDTTHIGERSYLCHSMGNLTHWSSCSPWHRDEYVDILSSIIVVIVVREVVGQFAWPFRGLADLEIRRLRVVRHEGDQPRQCHPLARQAPAGRFL